MKVLITGASGRLAGYVIKELSDKHDLILTSRRKSSDEFSKFSWVQGDLACFDDCKRAVEGVDAIQHLGAQPWPVDHPDSRKRAEEIGIPFDATFKTNMLGTYYLMQAAVEAGVKIVVMAGSNCALGHGFRISKTPFPVHFLPIDETHPCYPEDSYSYSKKAGEELLESYTRAYGIRTYVTRPAGITPDDRRQHIGKNAHPAGGWSDWMWCWVGSEDVASAHRLLMEKANNLPPHDIYFLNGNDTTALEPTRELVERFKPELLPLFIAGYMSGNQSFLSNAKLKRAVGWEHKTAWRNYR
ncbi:NAD(P)-dependent oxidoreductase [Candidatus Poribacteria bacterium]|nr:NAD(P)-dependent oxidoreductase [Candidatus Poribacteria bacterium]